VADAEISVLIRAKDNVILQRRYSPLVDQTTGVRLDPIQLDHDRLRHCLPGRTAARQFSYVDADTHKYLVLLTNDFNPPALTITLVYKCPWQIEFLFQAESYRGSLKGRRSRSG
jgi:hypothetical protein